MKQKIIFITKVDNLTMNPSYYNNIIGFYVQIIDMFLNYFDFDIVFVSKKSIVTKDLKKIFKSVKRFSINYKVKKNIMQQNNIIISDSLDIKDKNIIYYLPSLESSSLELLFTTINNKIRG